MPIQIREIGTYDADAHTFRVITFDDATSWLDDLANEYCQLRTRLNEIIDNLSEDTNISFDITNLIERLKTANLPTLDLEDALDTLRSDFGETLNYMVLEEAFGTTIAYKIIRDREIPELPGRGIDAVGIEQSHDGKLILVLSEVKVSDQEAARLDVVNYNRDSLHRQHLRYTQDLDYTSKKIWHVITHIDNRTPELRQLFFKAALYFDERDWTKVGIVANSFLVRPDDKHQLTDFGRLIENPGQYAPANIRFLIAIFPCTLEQLLTRWDAAIKKWGKR